MAILDIFLAQARQRSIEKLAEDYNTDKVAVPEMTTLEKIVSNPTVSDVIDYLDPEDNVLTGTLQGMGKDIAEKTDINSQKADLNSKANTDNWNDEKFQRRRLLTRRQNNELSKGPELTWLERFSNSAPVSKFLDFYDGSLPDRMVNSALSGESDRLLLGNLGEKAYNVYNYFSGDTPDSDKIINDYIDHKLDSNFKKQRSERRAKTQAEREVEAAKKLFLDKGITPEALMHDVALSMPSVKSMKSALKYLDMPYNALTNFMRKSYIGSQMRQAKLDAEMKNALSQQASQGFWGRLWNGEPKTYAPDYSNVKIPAAIKRDVPSDLAADKYRDLLHIMYGAPEQPEGVSYSNVLGDTLEGMGRDLGFRRVADIINGEF